jgi:small subunit ribosomal protein S13
MARIAGVNIPREKRVEIGLTYVFGIGKSTSQQVLGELGIDPNTKVRDLTDEEVTRLRNHVDQNLTVRGQRTRTNARTRKGPKKTVGKQRKK